MAFAPKQIGRVLPVADVTAGGLVPLAVGAIETARIVQVAQATAGKTLTLPAPSDPAPFPVIVANTGTASFVLYGVTMAVGTTGVFTWSGTAWQAPVQPASAVVLAAAYARGTRTTPQTTGIAAGSPVVFTALDPSSTNTDVTLNTTTGTITLAANRTYRLMASVGNVNSAGPNTRLALSWKNTTSGLVLGNPQNVYSQNDNALAGVGFAPATAFITTTASTTVQFVITGALGSIFPTSIGGSSGDDATLFPWFDIEVVSGNPPVSVLAQYGTAYQTGANIPAIGTSSAAAAVSTLFTLPGPGTFLVAYFGSGALLGTNGGAINYALYANPTGVAGAATGGVLVPNSEIRAIFENANASAYMATGTGVISITTTAATPYALGFYAAGSTPASTGSLSDTGGRTGVTWTQIGVVPQAGLLAGATATLPGAAGFVPTPLAGQQDATLDGDGAWDLTNRQAFVPVANLTANGSFGTAPLTVDIASVLLLNQTTAGITGTLPSPTASKARVLLLLNNGTASITVLGTPIAANGTAQFVWNMATSTWLPPAATGGTAPPAVGATSSLAGTSGAPVAAPAGTQTAHLRGDNTWDNNDTVPSSVLPDQPLGGQVNTDGFSVIFVAQSTAGQVVTLKPPVDTIRQRRIRVIHNGTQALTVQGAVMLAGTSQHYTYFGSIGGGWVADLAPDWRSQAPTYFSVEPLFAGAIRYYSFGGVRGVWRYIGAPGVPPVPPCQGVPSIGSWEPVAPSMSQVQLTGTVAFSPLNATLTAPDFTGALSISSGDYAYDATNRGLIVPYNGVYDLRGFVMFNANGTGQRRAQLAVAAGPTTPGLIYSDTQVAGTAVAAMTVAVAVTVSLTANTVVGLYVSQTSGGSLVVLMNTGQAPRLSMTLIRLT